MLPRASAKIGFQMSSDKTKVMVFITEKGDSLQHIKKGFIDIERPMAGMQLIHACIQVIRGQETWANILSDSKKIGLFQYRFRVVDGFHSKLNKTRFFLEDNSNVF